MRLVTLMLGSLFVLSACAPSSHSPIQIEDGKSIIGGDKVSAADPVASVTALLVDVHEGSVCTASILSSKWLLTAAHCVEGKDPSALVAGFALDFEELTKTDGAQKRRRIARAIAHPKFMETNKHFEELEAKYKSEGKELTPADIDAIKDWGDIALVELQTEIPATHHAVELLPEMEKLAKDQPVVLAGFGRTGAEPSAPHGILFKVEVKVQEPLWGTTEVLMNQREGKGACHGDSGGPAYVASNGKLLLFGVTSRGVGDTDVHCINSAAYTNLNAYRPWIREASGL